MRLHLILAVTLFTCSCSPVDQDGTSVANTISSGNSVAKSDRQVPAILESYAAAWRGAQEFQLREKTTLGIWVDGTGYTVILSNDGGVFVAGEPKQFDWGFETNLNTLQRLDSGSMNALTAMGQARASDPIPLDIRLPDSFSADADVRGYFVPLTLHFWNREWPETIKFGEGLTRFVHGANTTVLVYDEGLRSAWYQLKPGMHINSEPADQSNEFDSAVIIIRGHFGGKIDGAERVFNEGETVLIPAGISHEFYALDGEYGEFIILMWGDGA